MNTQVAEQTYVSCKSNRVSVLSVMRVSLFLDVVENSEASGLNPATLFDEKLRASGE
jgi:hypothetical protein